MELTITQQNVKGGAEVLMVRFSKRPLLSFPLTMRKLANHMIDEALAIDEKDSADLIALVQKYSKRRDEQGDADSGKSTPPEPTSTQPVVVALADRAGEYVTPLPPPTVIARSAPTEMDTLAELLDCARQAEIQMHAAADDLEHANRTFAEAERRADLAWQAFNEALHAALPTGTRILGIQADQ